MTNSTARALVLLLAASGLAACGSSAQSGPWLTMPDAAAHAAKFPMAADTAHGICTCNECHMTKDKTGAWVPSDTFKDFTCIGCHYTTANYPGLHHADEAGMAARHAAVPGYTYVDAECKRCHPAGIAVDHAAIFPLPHQNAAGTVVTQCSQCHVDPASRKVLGCAACHPHDLAATATAHAKVPDFSATDSGLCLRCHADGTVPRVAAHTAFAVGTGAHSGAAGGKCLSCHPQNRTTAPRTFAADFGKYVCLGCHVLVRPGVYHDDPVGLATLHDAGTSFTDAACYGCHKDGAAGAPSYHPQLFPIGAGTRHAGVTCGQCHTSSTRTDPATLACASCHAKTMGSSLEYVAAHTVSGYGIAVTKSSRNAAAVAVPMTSANCYKCHAQSQVDRAASHPGGEDAFGTGQHRAAGCLTCHNALLTKVVGATTAAPRTNWGSATGCNTCH